MGEPQVPTTFGAKRKSRPQASSVSRLWPQATVKSEEFRCAAGGTDSEILSGSASLYAKKRQDFLPLLVCGKALDIDINPLRGV